MSTIFRAHARRHGASRHSASRPQRFRKLIANLRTYDYLRDMKRTSPKTKPRPEPVDPMIEASEEAAGLLKAMANPVRLRILCMLAEMEMPVGEIADRLKIREQATSQQLAQLRYEGLIAPRKEAQRVYYRLASPAIERLLQALREIYCPAST
jgi:ArsR family transcriptional regulator, virulence genes transcriptional regulator